MLAHNSVETPGLCSVTVAVVTFRCDFNTPSSVPRLRTFLTLTDSQLR